MEIKIRAWMKDKEIFYYDFAKIPYDVKIEGEIFRIFSGEAYKGEFYKHKF